MSVSYPEAALVGCALGLYGWGLVKGWSEAKYWTGKLARWLRR